MELQVGPQLAISAERGHGGDRCGDQLIGRQSDGLGPQDVVGPVADAELVVPYADRGEHGAELQVHPELGRGSQVHVVPEAHVHPVLLPGDLEALVDRLGGPGVVGILDHEDAGRTQPGVVQVTDHGVGPVELVPDMAADRQGIVVPVLLRVFAQPIVRGQVAQGVDHLVADEPQVQVLVQVQERRVLGGAIVERGRLVVRQQVADVQADHEPLLLLGIDHVEFAILSGYAHPTAQAAQEQEVLLDDDHVRYAKIMTSATMIPTWRRTRGRSLGSSAVFAGRRAKRSRSLVGLSGWMSL